MAEPRCIEGLTLILEGDGSNTLWSLTWPRIGSIENHLASGLEKTSVQKTGDVVNGSGVADSSVNITLKHVGLD